MAYLVSDLITASLRLIGRMAPGRTAGPSELAAALQALNQMVDSWNTDRLFIYTLSDATYTLIPSQQTYSFGPSGANFTTTRLVTIERANIINLSNPSVPARTPLEILSDDEWAAVRVRNVGTSIPQKLYYDGAFPNGNISLYPYPTVANQLEIWSWSPIPSFVNLSDTFSVPPGYWEAMRYNLAVRFAPEVGADIPPSVMSLAFESKGRIESLNAPSPKLQVDSGLPRGGRRGDFNYLNGEVL